MYLLWGFFRWILGYAIIEIRGVYGEAFLSLCMKQEIDLWEIRRVCPGIIRVKLYSFALPRLDVLARKCGVTTESCGRFGLWETLKRYRLRPGIFLGVFLYFALMLILPRFVWSVEIPNADPVRAGEIRSVLLNSGFGVGSYVPATDFRELKYDLLLARDDLVFASITMQGARAVVDVRFASDAPDLTDRTPCNIVASRDGQIVSVLVREGVRYVTKGQTVQKGDLLVGGIVDTRLGYYVVHSKAEILARVTDVSTETVPLNQVRYERTGRVFVRWVWDFFGKEISLSLRKDCPFEFFDTVTETKCLSLGDRADIPILLTEIRYYQTEPISVSYTAEEALEMARNSLNEVDRIRLNGIEIEAEYETVAVADCAVTLTKTRSLIVDICEDKEFYFDDKGQ